MPPRRFRFVQLFRICNSFPEIFNTDIITPFLLYLSPANEILCQSNHITIKIKVSRPLTASENDIMLIVPDLLSWSLLCVMSCGKLNCHSGINVSTGNSKYFYFHRPYQLYLLKLSGDLNHLPTAYSISTKTLLYILHCLLWPITFVYWYS